MIACRRLFSIPALLTPTALRVAELIKKLRGAAGSVVSSLASATHVLSDQPEVNQRTADVLLAEGRGLPIVGEAFVDACLKMGSASLPHHHSLRCACRQGIWSERSRVGRREGSGGEVHAQGGEEARRGGGAGASRPRQVSKAPPLAD